MKPAQKEYEFELPVGYVDEKGNTNRKGVMRAATAEDEILPLKDPRVKGNPAYISVIILARVVEKLGNLEMINTHLIENLKKQDLDYLTNMYNEINENKLNRPTKLDS